jgi:hypothetical protein
MDYRDNPNLNRRGSNLDADRGPTFHADGHAICILPERSAAVPGFVTRPIEGLSLEREWVIATASGSTTPVEIRKIAQLASMYEWQ